ncbi:MAG: hypothetical protein ACOYMS_12390 [Terrimicrobiaceae bacterium]
MKTGTLFRDGLKVGILVYLAGLTACAHRNEPVVGEFIPFGERLAAFVSLQNSGRFDQLRTHFTRTATIQSPVTPQGAGVDLYLRALAAEPYTLTVKSTEVVYSFPNRAMTQSQVVASAPARFNLQERLTVEWRMEDGHWRIARMFYTDWPAIVGTWRRSGLKNEGSIELRVMPGGTYVVYTAEDYSAPAFRGRYRLDSNKITFADTSAYEAKQFQGGDGSYIFLRTPTGVTFRKVDDENPWRTERYDGAWSSAR